jgi:putative MATE family efflux protein
MAVGMALNALYMMVDRFWLGKLSQAALGAPSVSMPIFFFVFSFGIGLSQAGTALVSQYVGAGRHREADHAAGQTFLMLCAIATGLAVPVLAFTPQVLRLVNVPPQILGGAVVYLRILMLGLPLIAFTIGYGAVLRGLGDTITVVVIGVIANLVNLGLDPVLIFGWGGLPAMGVGGAALASLIARVLAAFACYVLLRYHRAGLHVGLAALRPHWPMGLFELLSSKTIRLLASLESNTPALPPRG